ncbi:MAG: Veg family protein [Clostridia bacterium]|nr:Veg family protein [Clostridia bacterium]
MREIVYGLEHAKRRAERLQGLTVRIKVNKGRNKFVEKVGKIVDLFPAVFTFVAEDENFTFSYSDLLTKMVKIFPVES